MGRLRPRSVRGRLQAKQERLCFFSVIFVTHPKSYTDRDDGSPRFRRKTVEEEVRTGGIVLRNIVAWAEPDRKQHFSVFRVPFDCPAHSLQETSFTSNHTNGMHRRRRHRAGGGTCPPKILTVGARGAQQNLWGTCKKIKRLR